MAARFAVFPGKDNRLDVKKHVFKRRFNRNALEIPQYWNNAPSSKFAKLFQLSPHHHHLHHNRHSILFKPAHYRSIAAHVLQKARTPPPPPPPPPSPQQQRQPVQKCTITAAQPLLQTSSPEKKKGKKKGTRNKEVNLVAQDRKCLIHETRCEFLAFCVGAVIWPPLARARPETKIDVSARTALRKRPFLEASGGKRFLCPSEKVLVAGWRSSFPYRCAHQARIGLVDAEEYLRSISKLHTDLNG